MSYLVLARKWRSQTFDEVVGQEHVTRTLKNAIERDRVAHALLFTGSRGIGKTSCARILAKSLNCEQGPTTTPCGECRSCVDITAGTSVDVFEIDGASNNGVEQVRELREAVKFVSSRGKRKMYIIDEVHMLSTAAFNALLKTLEEPPPHVLFVFATTEPHKIPDTILSRCQRYDFKRIPERRIVDHLAHIAQVEGIEVEPAALQHIAREAKGGMRDSLSLFDQVIAFCGNTITGRQAQEVLGVADRRTLHELTESILAGDSQRALELTEGLFEFGIDLQKFAGDFVKHLRDLMVIRTCAHPERLVDLPETEIAALADQVGPIHPARIHRLFSALMKGADEITRSAFPKLAFEMTLLRLCNQGRTLPLAKVLDGLARLESKLGMPVPPEPPGPMPPADPPPSPRPPSPEPPRPTPPTRPAPTRTFSPPPPVGSPQRAETPAEPAPRPQPTPRAAPPAPAPQPARPAAPARPAPPPAQPAPAVAKATPAAGVTGLESAGDSKHAGPVRAVDSVPWPPPAEMGLTPQVVAQAAARAGARAPRAAAPASPVAQATQPVVAQPTPTPAPKSPMNQFASALDTDPSAPVPPQGPSARALAAGAEGVEIVDEPAVEIVLQPMPADLDEPLDRFEHLMGQFTRARGAFIAKAIEHEARLLRFDDQRLHLAFPPEVYDAVLEHHQALEETLLEVVGRPVLAEFEMFERSHPAITDTQTLYGRRQERLEAARNARKQAARQDPGVIRLVEHLGAEIVELVVDPTSN